MVPRTKLARLTAPAVPRLPSGPPIRLAFLPAAELDEPELPDEEVGDGVKPIGPDSVVDAVAADAAEDTLATKFKVSKEPSMECARVLLTQS